MGRFFIFVLSLEEGFERKRVRFQKFRYSTFTLAVQERRLGHLMPSFCQDANRNLVSCGI